MAGGGKEGDFGFQIALMVDVVFVLLLFFMACAGQNVNEGFFQIGLPSPPEHPPVELVVPIVIEIDPLGNVSVGGTPISTSPHDRQLTQLHERLMSVMRESAKEPVIVRPSPDARHERVVDVLNACRAARVARLSFG